MVTKNKPWKTFCFVNVCKFILESWLKIKIVDVKTNTVLIYEFMPCFALELSTYMIIMCFMSSSEQNRVLI